MSMPNTDQPRAISSAEGHAPAGGRLLNVGCGNRFHPAWVNVDVVPAAADVMAVDVRKGLPFGNGEFAAAYCSHVLEHLSGDEAAVLLAQVCRVLAPGGIVRVVVPDLEAVAREYLRLLDVVRRERSRATEADYDWILLELLDQVARDRTGGDMAPYLLSADLPNRAYILSRIGSEAERVWQSARQSIRSRLLETLRARGIRRVVNMLRVRATGVLIGMVGGRSAGSAYLTGVFRQSGEVHRRMYDAFSLARALTRAGFAHPRVCAATESSIPAFTSYLLDVDEQGRVRKPDSLFMEAERPRA